MNDYGVIVLGEALIDFVPIEDNVIGKFKAVPGGAPANVAYGLANLGNKVSLISRVGKDPLGKSVINTMKKGGVKTDYIQVDDKRPTASTIVMPESSDMLRYIIYRNATADGFIKKEEIPEAMFEKTKILHYGTLAMCSEVTCETTLDTIKKAKKANITTSLDVNLRPKSWEAEELMIDISHKLIETSDIVKMTKEEGHILGVNPEELAKNSEKIVLVTSSNDAAEIYYKQDYFSCDVPQVEVVDETGAGDAFVCGFLHFYIRYFEKMKKDDFLRSALRFAVHAGSETVQMHGAITSISLRNHLHSLEEEMKQLINKTGV